MFSNSRMFRIEWQHCDPASIVFYPRYFVMFDSSTTYLFEKALGMTKIKFIKHYDFIGYPMVDTRAKFHIPGCSATTWKSRPRLPRSGDRAFPSSIAS